MLETIAGALSALPAGVRPFILYLVGINILTFVLFAIDYVIVCRNQDEDTGLMDGRVMALFAVAGGVVGMLLALCIFTRLYMNKHNIVWWFSAIACLIVWALVVLVWSGTITPSFNAFGGFNAYACGDKHLPPCHEHRHAVRVRFRQEEG